METSKQNMEHLCVICNASFEGRQSLQEHFRKHATGLGPVSKRKFINKSEIQCDVCPAKFDNPSKAVQHKFKMHRNNTEKYYCPWCGKQFTIKQMHEIHVKNDHLNKLKEESESTFTCEKCDAFFYVKSVYEHHTSHYHQYSYQSFLNNTMVLPPSKKIVINCVGDVQSAYYCHLCGYEYVLKYNLQNHLLKYHKNYDITQLPAEIIKCSTCDASFYNKKAYDVHNSFHQPGDMYVTSEEMRLNVVTRVDQDFDLRRVRTTKNFPVKSKRMSHQSANKTLITEEDLLTFSPPPSDSSDSETDVDSKTKIKTYSKKEPISLIDFVHMNKDIFENKSEISKQTTVDSGKKCDDMIENSTISNTTGENNLHTKENASKETLHTTDNCNSTFGNKLIKIEIEENFFESTNVSINNHDIINVDMNMCIDNENISNKQTSEINASERLPSKRSVKLVSKDEVEKLKNKGLVKIISKNQIQDMNKDLVEIKSKVFDKTLKNNRKQCNTLITEKKASERRMNINREKCNFTLENKLMKTEIETNVLDTNNLSINDPRIIQMDVDISRNNELNPNKQTPKGDISDSKLLSNKKPVKVVTKEELEKLKSKGLIKLVSKDKLLSMNIRCKLEEKSTNEMKTQLQKSVESSELNFKTDNTEIYGNSKFWSNNTMCKKEPVVKLTRLDESVLKKKHTNKPYSNKIHPKRPLKVS